MSNSSTNQGLIDARVRRMRGDDSQAALDVGYQNAGVSTAVPGDDDAPFVKQPPFVSMFTAWGQRLPFVSTEYVFLPVLDVGNVRKLTAYFEFTGGSSDASRLSILAGAVAPGQQTADINSFFPIATITQTVTSITLGAPFTSPASSRPVMPGELRTAIVANNITIRFCQDWDVSGFNRVTLAVLDLGYSDDNGAELRTFYTLSN